MAFRQKLILKPLLQTRTQIRSAERPATTPKSQPSIQSATKRSISSPIWSIFPAAPRPQAPIAEKVRTELRSEEHTSELQSRRDLVCRLLLEKKKKKNRT